MIVLLGYMGSGKTAVCQSIAGMSAKNIIDLDTYIEQVESRKVAQIFEDRGAIYFRKTERAALKRVINELKPDVLSLGGGTPCYYDNMHYLVNQPGVVTIYLQASVVALTNRLFPERDQRPLLHAITSKEELASFIGKHLFERSYFYEMAHVTIKTDGKMPDAIAREILARLL